MRLAADAPPTAADRPRADLLRRALRTSLPPFTRERVAVLEWILRLATAGAFIGHGAYGAFTEKPGWYGFFAELGFTRADVDANHLMRWTGGFEMTLGVLALIAPIPSLLLFMVAWKIGTEFVWYPLHALPAWEWVERWSNYTAPLALLVVRGIPATPAGWFRLRRASSIEEVT